MVPAPWIAAPQERLAMTSSECLSLDKYAAREWRSRLRDVLNTVWDPIGGCPPDEYDTYNGKLAAMVREGASDAAVIRYLLWAETEYMGLTRRTTPPDDARREQTLAAIRALGPIP
jgi:hypothetical protein